MPAVSNRLFKYNKEANTTKPINFKGMAVGNGLTDPRIQYGAYSDYAVMNKLISESTRTRIKAVSFGALHSYPACRCTVPLQSRQRTRMVTASSPGDCGYEYLHCR